MKKKLLKGTLMLTLLSSPLLVLSACGGPGTPADSEGQGGSGDSKGGGDSQTSQDGGRISSDWETIPANTNPNLKYFGFYHPDGFVSEPSMLKEIHDLDLSNFFLLDSSKGTDALLEKLNFIKENNYTCTVGIPSNIWNIDDSQTMGIGKVHTLKSDYQEIFRSYTEPMKPFLEDGTIYAFYTDEPAWNGIPEDQFVTLTKWLSEAYPNTGRMACFTGMAIGIGKDSKLSELNSTYFDYLTDVAYDNYSDWNDETRLGWLEKLKAKTTKNQWLWGTTRTFEDNPERTSTIIDSLKGFYTEAIQEPRYRGLTNFSWSNGFDGDWGYGAKTFVMEDSEYYSRDVHRIMSDVGRSIMGKPLIDWSKVATLTLTAPTEVYNIGEKVPFPICAAVTADGEDMDIHMSLTSPSGVEISTEDGEFIPTESGDYIFKVSCGSGDTYKEKQCPISVRYENEISVFENEAYYGDAGGDKDSFWCWPREVVTNFSHTGKGCLKVNPHATDGTWPLLTFNRDGNQLWNISEMKSISLWVYNPSDEPIKGFGFIITDEFGTNSSKYYCLKDIPAKEWTNIVADVNSIAAAKPDLDLTKVIINFGNAASDYQNRTSFFIDDVMLIPGREVEPSVEEGVVNGFESSQDLAKLPTATESDAWCWPRAISDEQAHGGKHSLKVTPHATDGTWPVVNLGSYDLSNASSVELWVYFDSEKDYDFFGLIIGANKYQMGGKAVAKTWTKFSVDVSAFADKVEDLTAVEIKFGNIGADYADRSPLYLDSFNIIEKTEPVNPDKVPAADVTNPFEADSDLSKLPTATESDAWCWPRAISDEQAHTGDKSLKVTPHPTDGTWPIVDFGTYDLTEVEEVELWVYFDSENDYDKFGLMVGSHTVLANAVSKSWVKFSVDSATLVEKGVDLASAQIKFGNCGGDYPDRSPLFLDDFNLVAKAEEVLPTNGFESEEEFGKLPAASESDAWCWPRALSDEQAHGGTHSLKVTPHATDGTWPIVDFGTHDLTEVKEVELWVYFDSDKDYDKFGLMVGSHTTLANAVSKTWVKFSIETATLTAEGIDLASVQIKFGNCGSDYPDRSPLYLDDFNLIAK